MKIALTLVAVFFSPIAVHAITIDTVPVGIGGAGEDIQPNGIFGYVATDYRIATTEVTNAQYVAFLNAVAASDPYALYDTRMNSRSRGGITRSGSSGSFTYSVKADQPDGGPGGTNYTYGDKPVIFVSWYDAIRFTNWLNNGATLGASTETGAYTLLGGSATPSNGNSITRNSGARWFLPTENQWYKAAYYSGTGDVFYGYPTKSNTAPTNDLPMDDTGNSANFHLGGFTQDESYPLTAAGAYAVSKSFYGTFDQGGNVWEWNETFDSVAGTRIYRGGSFESESNTLNASYRGGDIATTQTDSLGFRVALAALPGDYNANGFIDAADYVVWRKYVNQPGTIPNDATPPNVTQADYDFWRAHFGQAPAGASLPGSLLLNAVPEPSTCALLAAALGVAHRGRRRKARVSCERSPAAH